MATAVAEEGKHRLVAAVELRDGLQELMAAQNQTGTPANSLFGLVQRTVHDEQHDLAEQIGVVERRRGDGMVRRSLETLLRDETTIMGKHIGEIELDFLTDLRVIERDWNDDREENGGDVQRVDVAVVVAKEVFQRVRLLQNAEKRLQERAFHQKSVHSLVHSDVSEHMKHHLLEKQLQFFLVEPPQLRRHTRKDRHGLRENRHVGLLVIQQHHKRCQCRSRYNASQTGLASKQRTERSDDFAQRTQTEHDATLVLCGGRFVDGELKVRREERERRR